MTATRLVETGPRLEKGRLWRTENPVALMRKSHGNGKAVWKSSGQRTSNVTIPIVCRLSRKQMVSELPNLPVVKAHSHSLGTHLRVVRSNLGIGREAVATLSTMVL